MVRNTYIYPRKPSLRLSPRFRLHRRTPAEVQLVTVSGDHMQEAGANRTSSSPIRWPMASNMCVPAARRFASIYCAAAPRSSFRLIGMNLPMEVFKAARARVRRGRNPTQRSSRRNVRSLLLRTYCEILRLVVAAKDASDICGAHCNRGDGGERRKEHPVSEHQRARRGAWRCRSTLLPVLSLPPRSFWRQGEAARCWMIDLCGGFILPLARLDL